VILHKRGISGGAFFAVALAMSLMAHVWAFASLLQRGAPELGSVDVATSAISVNLETTDVIDAMESAAAKEAASSPAGAPEEAAKAAKEKIVPEAAKPPADEQARSAAEIDAERQAEEEAEREKTKRKLTETEEDGQTKRDKAQKSAAAGGAGTIGAAESQESQGQVSASQGSILNYGASLRALISSNTPRNFRKTSVRVAFSVAPSGGLTAVGVIKSSDNPEVDKRIVDLVRKLSPRFPLPPPGASANQLSFNIEIIFR
jgi:TolA protein